MDVQKAELRNEDLPALFWDEMPENAADNPDGAAIQAILDESTPEERALSFKDQGNAALKTGMQQRKKFYLRQAIDQYTQGLDLMCADDRLVCTLYANRAHVNLLLGNYRRALEDARAALKKDPEFTKACWRGAKAAAGLRLWEDCLAFCERGLALDPSNADLARLQEQATRDRAADERRQAEDQALAVTKRAPAAALAQTLLGRGWRIGRPQFSVGDSKPSLDEDGDVHWPVILFYPEANMQQDVIQDFCSSDRFCDHLDAMFGPEAPPLEWDTAGDYARGQVELYYLSHASDELKPDDLTEALYGGWPQVRGAAPARYGPNAATWQRVDEGDSLDSVLGRPDHIVPGIPVFFVLSAANRDYRDRFLSGDIPLL